MKQEHKLIITVSKEELIKKTCSPCKTCRYVYKC